MSTRYSTGVRFMKVYPHDHILRRITKAQTDVLNLLISKAIKDRNTHFNISEQDRQSIATEIECSVKTVSNALSALSRGAEVGGPELLVKYKAGKYRLNPSFYFIGNELLRDKAIEEVLALRRMRRARLKAASHKPKKAEVISLTMVS